MLGVLAISPATAANAEDGESLDALLARVAPEVRENLYDGASAARGTTPREPSGSFNIGVGALAAAFAARRADNRAAKDCGIDPTGDTRAEIPSGDRARERDQNVQQLEPVRAPGRVYRVRPRHRDVRSRVVYTSRGHRAGFSVGNVWLRADFGEVRFRRGFYGRRVVLQTDDLRDLLGRHAVRRVKNAANRAGIYGPMRGRWVGQPRGVRVLVVTVDGFEVAEFSDYDRDGFVDQVFVIGVRRPRRTVSRW